MRKLRTKTVQPEVPVGLPAVAVFTREHPCTKLQIWNCFRGKRGFVRVQIGLAHAIVGKNAPRVMLANDRIVQTHSGEAEFYTLTDDGKEWLTKGITNYLKNHPEDKPKAKNLPAALRK